MTHPMGSSVSAFPAADSYNALQQVHWLEPEKVIFTGGALPQIPRLFEVHCSLNWLTAHAKLLGLYGGFNSINAVHMKHIPTELSHIEKGLVNFDVMADQALICYANSLDPDSLKTLHE